jgi:RNA polymerase sigma-70 factor (ECF subfamily)
MRSPTLFEADLLLAENQAKGSPEALRQFESEVMAPVAVQLRRHHPATEVDEALQALRESLLVGPEAAVRLGSYAGQAPLKGWIAAIALRKLLENRRKQGGSYDSLSRLDEGGGQSPQLERALAQARFAPLFKEGLTRGLAELPRRCRIALRMNVLDGLSVDKIGAIFHVHRSTAARWLADARQHLHDTALAHVRAAAAVSEGELSSLSRLVLSQTELSLPRLLAPKAEDAP